MILLKEYKRSRPKKKKAKNLTDNIQKKIDIASKFRQICSISLVVREIKIKTVR